VGSTSPHRGHTSAGPNQNQVIRGLCLTLKKPGGFGRPFKQQTNLTLLAERVLQLGIEDHLAFSLINGESRSNRPLPNTFSRTSRNY